MGLSRTLSAKFLVSSRRVAHHSFVRRETQRSKVVHSRIRNGLERFMYVYVYIHTYIYTYLFYITTSE